MRKYVTMRKTRLADADGEPDAENYLARTVYEPEPQIIETGLLDSQGQPIYAIEAMGPIGFVIHEPE